MSIADRISRPTIARTLAVAAVLAACAPVGTVFAQSTPSGSSQSGGGDQGGGQRGNGGGGGSGQSSSGNDNGRGGGQGGYGGGRGDGAGGASSGNNNGHGGGQGGYGGGRGGYDNHGGHGYAGGRGQRRAAFDRSNPRWWTGRREFSGYAGHRPGFFFVPGYGYRPLAAAYAARSWVVGAILPPELRGYAVADPTVYGVDLAPVGYRWIYVNDGIALIDSNRGVIVRSVWHIW